MKILAYTITRAHTAARGKLLLETLTRGRETADHDFDWHVYCNGATLAHSICESAFATKIINWAEYIPVNEGQHPPSNRAIAKAIDEGYDYVLRIDDDVEWLSKRWLAKLVEASHKLGDKMVLSPLVKGLRWQPPQSQSIQIEGVPIRIIDGPIGGICRFTPVELLKSKPYVSDVRWPMGGGDAMGFGKWAIESKPLYYLAYCQHIRIRHAKSTDGQEKDDPQHFDDHDLFQHVPYIPTWKKP
jgi:hypothetical protein